MYSEQDPLVKEYTKTFNEILPKLRRRVTKVVGEPNCDDIFQEAYIHGYKKLDQFESRRGGLKAWISRIVHNMAIDFTRKHKRMTYFSDERLEYIAAKNPLSGHEIVRDLDTHEICEEALSRLDEKYSLALRLYLQEFSYKEIRDRMNLPMGTVMSRLYRGKRLLAKELVDLGFCDKEKLENLV